MSKMTPELEDIGHALPLRESQEGHCCLQKIVASAARRLSTPVRGLRTPSKACTTQREGKHGLDDEPSLYLMWGFASKNYFMIHTLHSISPSNNA